MGYSNIEVLNDPLDGVLLVAEGEGRKGGAYIAKITGTDPTYRYKREFLGTVQWHGGVKQARVPLCQLGDGYPLEIRAGGSWKNDYRHFYKFVTPPPDVVRITETEMRELLGRKLRGEPAASLVETVPCKRDISFDD